MGSSPTKKIRTISKKKWYFILIMLDNLRNWNYSILIDDVII